MASRSLQHLFLDAVTARRTSARALTLLLGSAALAQVLWFGWTRAPAGAVDALTTADALPSAVATASEVESELALLPRTLERAADGVASALAANLEADLARLSATVEDLRNRGLPTPPGSEEGSPESGDGDLPADEGPSVVERARRDIGSTDWILAVRDAEPGEALAAALEPVVEARITGPRFTEARRAWEESAAADVRAHIEAAAAGISRLRGLAPEDRNVWDELTAGSRDLLLRTEAAAPAPPEAPRWWLPRNPPAAPETDATAPLPSTETLRAIAEPRDAPGLAEFGAALHRRALAAREALEIRLTSRESSGASRADEEPAGTRGPPATLPAALGLLLALALLGATRSDRDLLWSTVLFVESGGPVGVRDWTVAQGRTTAPRPELAGRPHVGGWWTRSFVAVVGGVLWVGLLAVQLGGAWTVPTESLVRTSSIVGAGLVLAAGVLRALALAPALRRLRNCAEGAPDEVLPFEAEDWVEPDDWDEPEGPEEDREAPESSGALERGGLDDAPRDEDLDRLPMRD